MLLPLLALGAPLAAFAAWLLVQRLRTNRRLQPEAPPEA